MPLLNNTNGVFSDEDLSISIVICTYSFDRRGDLGKAIESIQTQTIPPLEAIVVVDHNEDLLRELKTAYPDITVVPNNQTRGLSGARNTGIGVAQGGIIAFLDDDAVAAEDWVEKHIAGYVNRNIAGVGGKIIPLWENSRPSWFPEEYDWVVGCTYKGMPETLQPVSKVIGCNMSFRREVFDEVGGFSSNLGRIGTYPLSGEESELCFRIAQRWDQTILLYDPEARVQHLVPSFRAKWSYFRKRCFMGGVSNYLLSRVIGTELGLATERQYILKTLSCGVVGYISEGLSEKGSYGLRKAVVLIIGFFFTLAGYIWGWVAIRKISK